MTPSLIQRRRKWLGLSQAAVAAQLGLKRSGYSRIERGKIPITLERARKLAAILDATVDDLFPTDPTQPAPDPLYPHDRVPDS